MTTEAPDETLLPELVRRRDLRAGAPYPSAPAVLGVLALLTDVALHLTTTLVIATRFGLSFWPGVAVYAVISLTHRVLLRRWWGATLGGLLCGLRFVVEATGRPPTLGQLAKVWLLTAVLAVST
ncbi:RDD family protein [Amycolatopsis solani]|uniref:RDD family protein n=1 Tax=Amycolatopsis solani TaxID=3028615 RepID=UPI0025AFFDB4|nr:RDD family protein [Amycolatopsis sp. MEP2-6]